MFGKNESSVKGSQRARKTKENHHANPNFSGRIGARHAHKGGMRWKWRISSSSSAFGLQFSACRWQGEFVDT
jgi:hypothetical protein